MVFTKRSAFTLVEILVVIGILASLSVATVLVLNPAEMLKSSRDTVRLADLATLNSALSLLSTDKPGISMGASTTIYTSLIDSSSDCSSWHLPVISNPNTGLPYGYHCSTADVAKKTDGTGWVPVDFRQLSGGTSPLATLPIDPVNSSSTGLYYTFMPGGSWGISAVLESAGRAVTMANDGGRSAAVYEIGSDLKLTPKAALNRALASTQLSVGNPTLTLSKSYDGTATATVSAGALSGVASGDTVNVAAVASYDSSSVGTGKTITVSYVLSGANADNYATPSNYVVNAGIITGKQLTIGTPTLTTSKTYDGTTSASVTAGSLSGVFSGDTVSVSASASYDSSSVGTGKTITVSYSLSGANAGNYSAPSNYSVNTGVILSASYYASCKAILDGGASTGSGVYTIKPGGTSFQVYCDMTTDGGGWALVALPTDSYGILSEPSGLLDPTSALGARNDNYWSATSVITFTQIRFTDAWPTRTAYDIATFGSSVSISSLMSSYSTYSQYPVASSNVSSSIGSTCFIIRGMSYAVAQWSDQADWLFMGFHSLCSTPIANADGWDVFSYASQWVVGARDNSADPQNAPTAVGRMSTQCHWNANSCPTTNRTIIWVR